MRFAGYKQAVVKQAGIKTAPAQGRRLRNYSYWAAGTACFFWRLILM